MRKKDCLLLLIFVLCSYSCTEKTETNGKTEPVKVKVMKVGKANHQETLHYSGTVTAENGSTLSFPFMARIEQINVSVGSSVKKGQLIAKVNSESMKSAYEASKASLEQAKDAYRRMKELYDKGSLAEIKWVEIQSKLRQAASMEEIARKNLNDCKLYAPYSGTVAEKYVETGQNVAPGSPVVQLVTGNELAVRIAVPEKEVGLLKEGQSANIIIPALDNMNMEGYISEKGVLANPLSRSYEIKISIKGEHKSLLPGMVAEAYITKDCSEPSYIIPSNILQTDEKNRTFVWLNVNGKATKKEIHCGEFTPTGVSVLSGLKDGDEIIIEGQHKVCENTALSF